MQRGDCTLAFANIGQFEAIYWSQCAVHYFKTEPLTQNQITDQSSWKPALYLFPPASDVIDSINTNHLLHQNIWLTDSGPEIEANKPWMSDFPRQSTEINYIVMFHVNPAQPNEPEK